MAKQGQHNNDSHDYDKSPGNNNSTKSVEITTGTQKKQDTYKQQAGKHQATGKAGTPSHNDWNTDTRDKPRIENSVRARDSDLDSGRNGSESNC